MAEGTIKMTQYEYVFVFWMVVDCLLRSKFVGYSILFTENTNGIIEGAEIFFPSECAPTQNKVHVGEINGHFDPFVDNEIDLSPTHSNGSALRSTSGVIHLEQKCDIIAKEGHRKDGIISKELAPQSDIVAKEEHLDIVSMMNFFPVWTRST